MTTFAGESRYTCQVHIEASILDKPWDEVVELTRAELDGLCHDMLADLRMYWELERANDT